MRLAWLAAFVVGVYTQPAISCVGMTISIRLPFFLQVSYLFSTYFHFLALFTTNSIAVIDVKWFVSSVVKKKFLNTPRPLFFRRAEGGGGTYYYMDSKLIRLT